MRRLGVPVPLDDDALGLVVVEVGVVLQRSGVLGPHDLHGLSGQPLELLEFALVNPESSDTHQLTHGPSFFHLRTPAHPRCSPQEVASRQPCPPCPRDPGGSPSGREGLPSARSIPSSPISKASRALVEPTTSMLVRPRVVEPSLVGSSSEGSLAPGSVDRLGQDRDSTVPIGHIAQQPATVQELFTGADRATSASPAMAARSRSCPRVFTSLYEYPQPSSASISRPRWTRGRRVSLRSPSHFDAPPTSRRVDLRRLRSSCDLEARGTGIRRPPRPPRSSDQASVARDDRRGWLPPWMLEAFPDRPVASIALSMCWIADSSRPDAHSLPSARCGHHELTAAADRAPMTDPAIHAPLQPPRRCRAGRSLKYQASLCVRWTTSGVTSRSSRQSASVLDLERAGNRRRHRPRGQSARRGASESSSSEIRRHEIMCPDGPSPRPPRTPGRTRSAGPAPLTPAGTIRADKDAQFGTADCPGIEGEATPSRNQTASTDSPPRSAARTNRDAIHVLSAEPAVASGLRTPSQRDGPRRPIDACLAAENLQIARHHRGRMIAITHEPPLTLRRGGASGHVFQSCPAVPYCGRPVGR